MRACDSQPTEPEGHQILFLFPTASTLQQQDFHTYHEGSPQHFYPP
jgi:hypothetical protein